jgi:hypothetical protein
MIFPPRLCSGSMRTLSPTVSAPCKRRVISRPAAPAPAAWSWSSVALSPYARLYADYFFSQDDAQTVGLTTVPLLQGFAARVTGGVTAKFANGAALGAGGEFGGIGLSTHFWTWTGPRQHSVLIVIARSVSDEAIQNQKRKSGSLRGACHRAGHFGPDPLASNDELDLSHGFARTPPGIGRGTPVRAARCVRRRCRSARRRRRPATSRSSARRPRSRRPVRRIRSGRTSPRKPFKIAGSSGPFA